MGVQSRIKTIVRFCREHKGEKSPAYGGRVDLSPRNVRRLVERGGRDPSPALVNVDRPSGDRATRRHRVQVRRREQIVATRGQRSWKGRLLVAVAVHDDGVSRG